MSSNNVNSNYFSVANYTNKGISGMVSGLDTESMVKNMLAATQKKIDTQNALKQRSLWRQEFYRDVISTINGLTNKYLNPAFDASPLNNLINPKFFNSKLATVMSGSAVKVLGASSNASIGPTTVAVKQLAKAASLQSGTSVGVKDSITGSALDQSMVDSLNKTLVVSVTVGAAGIPDNIAIDLNGINTKEDMIDAINNQLVGKGVTAKLFGDKLRLVTDATNINLRIQNQSSSWALQMTGLTAGSMSALTDTGAGQMIQGGNGIRPDAGLRFSVTLDGVEKQITLNPESDASGKVTMETLRANLNAELDRAFNDYIDVELTPDNQLVMKMKYAAGQEGHTLSIYGSSATGIGFTPGASSRLNTGSSLGDIPGLGGDRFVFEINGKTFTFSKEDSIGAMINKINSSNIGVQMSYSSLSGKFAFTATSTGAGAQFDIRQIEGDLLGTLFKHTDGTDLFAPGSSISSPLLTVGVIQGNIPSSVIEVDRNAKFVINVNGTDYTFTQTYEATQAEAAFNLSVWLDNHADLKGRIEYDINTGELLIHDDSLVRFSSSTIDMENAAALAAGKKTDLALALGFIGTGASGSNIAGINDQASEVPAFQALYDAYSATLGLGPSLSGTVGDFIDLLNTKSGITGFEVSYVDGRIKAQALAGSTLPVNLTAEQGFIDFFGGAVSIPLADSTGAMDPDVLLNPTAYAGVYTVGQDALLTINGVDTSRASNTFEIDGLTLQLTNVSPETSPGVYEETVIQTERDIESIIETFRNFVEDYNAMVDKINGYVNAESTYRDYPPLTAEQKREMTEKEIEMWEEQAKIGLLRRDDILDPFLNSLYALLYAKPLTSSYALYDIGIESPDYKNPGRLTLDENRLRMAFDSDPGSIEALFTDPDAGIAVRMRSLMDSVALVSVSNPGSLVALAGSPGLFTEKNNTLSTEIERINDRLKDLQDKYERERARYWNQFNTMERIMATYMAQSQYIEQMFMDMNAPTSYY